MNDLIFLLPVSSLCVTQCTEGRASATPFRIKVHTRAPVEIYIRFNHLFIYLNKNRAINFLLEKKRVENDHSSETASKGEEECCRDTNNVEGDEVDNGTDILPTAAHDNPCKSCGNTLDPCDPIEKQHSVMRFTNRSRSKLSF